MHITLRFSITTEFHIISEYIWIFIVVVFFTRHKFIVFGGIYMLAVYLHQEFRTDFSEPIGNHYPAADIIFELKENSITRGGV